MRHPEPVTLTPKYRVGQVVKFWKWQEHGPKLIRYERITRVKAQVEWKNGVPDARVEYDLECSRFLVPESDVVAVVAEETQEEGETK